jgi:HTH-like domain/Integrase core domain
VSEKYSFIDAEYADESAGAGSAPTIVQMCEWLGASKSGYYEWRSRPQNAAGKRRELLKIKIKALFEANNEEYGYRRMRQVLVRGGEQVDDETVRKLMRELGLEPCQPKPWRRSLTEQDGQAGPIPDLVKRDFTASRPGEKMVGDITYIWTWEGWLYLATVIDCATRKIIGWTCLNRHVSPFVATSSSPRAAGTSVSTSQGSTTHTKLLPVQRPDRPTRPSDNGRLSGTSAADASTARLMARNGHKSTPSLVRTPRCDADSFVTMSHVSTSGRRSLVRTLSRFHPGCDGFVTV